MKSTQFKALLESLGSLTPSQRKRLASALGPAVTAAAPSPALEKLQPSACPHCASGQVVRNGMAGGLQRYICRSCSKTFNATTGTPLSRLRNKEQFEAYADCVRQVRIPRDGGHDSTLMADRVPPSWRTPFHGDGGQHSILMADT